MPEESEDDQSVTGLRLTSLFDGPVLPAYQTGSVVTSIPAY